MNFKERKKQPKVAKGDLGQKRHVFSGIRVDGGTCGDNYCPGHAKYYVKCSCGFAVQVSAGYGAEDEIAADHRRAVTEHHLGLTFAENN
jgi:hypothetical protein